MEAKLPTNLREAVIAAIDEGGYIQEFGPSYNRFTLADCLRGVDVVKFALLAEVNPLVEAARNLVFGERGNGQRRGDHDELDALEAALQRYDKLKKEMEG